MNVRHLALARAVARGALPAPLRYWLARTYFRLETMLHGSWEDRFSARLVPLYEFAPLFDRNIFASGPIALVNNALASGGAERQIVNTLHRLATRSDCSCGLLCLRLGERDMDFFRDALNTFPGFVRNAMPAAEADHQLAASLSKAAIERFRGAIGWLPWDVREEITRLAADFAALKPRVVHAWQDSGGISAVYAARLIGVPRVILSTRNVRPTHFAWYRPYMRLAYQDIVADSDIVICNNSEAGRADYAEWLNIPLERFVVVHNGLDLSPIRKSAASAIEQQRARLGIPGDALIVGSIFRFYDEKRPSLWVQAAAEVARRRPDIHFVVFGDGPLQKTTRALAQRLGFGDRFHTPGTIEDTGAGLSLFDTFLLTSQFEGTPNVVLEASALGVPVVATDAGGTAEAIDEGITGYLIRTPTPRAIAERIIEVLSTPSWRTKAASEGPAFVARRFGMNRMIEETIALYDREMRSEPGR
jgi:glycosyltransferase involved in cell wall biosynthesis